MLIGGYPYFSVKNIILLRTVKSFKYCHFLLKSSIPRYAPLVRAEISRKKDHGNMDKP